MSAETRKDIEAEIGRNGWRLVGKIALVVLVPTIGGFFWLGALGADVNNHIKLGGHAGMEVRMNAVERGAATRDQKIENIDATLERIERRQEEIKSLLGGRRRLNP